MLKKLVFICIILPITFSTITYASSNQEQISETVSANDQMNLFWAAETGNTEEIKSLLEKGYDINFRCKESYPEWTPLMIAAANNHYDAVKLLLEKGANPNLQNQFGRTALQFAVRYKFFPIIEILLDNNADPFIISYENNKAPNSAMAYALIGAIEDAEMYEILKYLVHRTEKFNFEFWEDTPLMISVAYDDYDFTKYLLEHGADINHVKIFEIHGMSSVRTIDSFARSEKMKLLLDSYMNKSKN